MHGVWVKGSGGERREKIELGEKWNRDGAERSHEGQRRKMRERRLRVPMQGDIAGEALRSVVGGMALKASSKTSWQQLESFGGESVLVVLGDVVLNKGGVVWRC